MEHVDPSLYGDKKDYSQYYRSEQEREDQGLSGIQKLGIGVAVGVGAIAIGHRTGAVSRFAKFLDEDLRIASHALREAVDHRTSIARGSNKGLSKGIKQVTEDFVANNKRLRAENKEMLDNPLLRREMDMERYLRQVEELIGSKREGHYTGAVAEHVEDTYRYAEIMAQVRNSNMQGLKNQAAEVERVLESAKSGQMKHYSAPEMKKYMKNKGFDDDQAIDEINRIRENINQRNFLDDTPEASRVVEIMQQSLRKMSSERLEELTSKHGSVRTALTGHKQATVQDILRLNDEGIYKIDEQLHTRIKKTVDLNPKFADVVFDDNLYLVTKKGKQTLADHGVFKEINRKAADWTSGTLPGSILHLRDILNIKEARETASFRFLDRGTKQATLNAHMGVENTEALNEHVVFIAGKAVKLFDWDTIRSGKALTVLNKEKDMYLTSSQFGSVAKAHRHMSDLMTPDVDRNIIQKGLDIGNQDKDTFFNQGISMLTKFGKKDWERNWINNILKDGISDIDEYYKLNTYFKLNTKAMTPRLMNQLTGQLDNQTKGWIDELGTNFSNSDDILALFKKIGDEETNLAGNGVSKHTSLVNLYKQFQKSPDGVLGRKTPIGEANPIIGHHTHIRTGQHEIEQQVSLYMMNKMVNKRSQGLNGSTFEIESKGFRNDLNRLFDEGKILKDDLQAGEELLNYSIFRAKGSDIRTNTQGTIFNTGKMMQEDVGFQDAMKKMVKRTNPFWERYSEIEPINLVEDSYLLVNEAGWGKHFAKAFTSDASLKERFNSAAQPLKQLVAGRKNMEDVTTATMFPYYAGYRLQDMLGNIGLGFSDDSMSSAVSIGVNLFTKRLAPAYAGVEGYKYFNYKMDQYTGAGIDERYQNMIANDRLGEALYMTEEKQYELEKSRQLKPGLEHWEAMPSIHLPFFGEVGPGPLLNMLAAPYFGSTPLDEKASMNYEETWNDLMYGVEEQRKSKWWFMGSKSAYRGDRISEFAPNEFRKAHSDHEWSDTGLTADEYFSHSLFPTLENPLGILSFALGTRDPYYFERKHYADRPYMLTGELFNPNTMFLGDIGNATIGNLLKPVEAMHQEFWEDPILLNEQANRLGNRPDGVIRTNVSPGGRVKNDVLASPDDYGGYDETQATSEGAQYIISNQLGKSRERTGAFVAHDITSGESVFVPAHLAKDELPVAQYFDEAIATEMPPNVMKAGGAPAYTQGYSAQVSTAPRSMIDEEYGYKDELLRNKLGNIQDPRSASWRTQEFIENWDEPLGIYKWIVNDEILGHNPYEGKMVIERADQAYNASNRFWESELGSFGASFSEFGRRFIRRNDGQLDYYNPIRNTMPDWMPGGEYFINFQTGDPYSKVPHGERRLPGAGYESLNQLHSDEFGDYGAYDRFKILGDVAPWSDEYKYWSQFLMDNLEDKDLRKEATQIRKQVSARKKKYDFQEYRFKNNDVVYEEVTVKKFLDDYTFLTEEMGDNPIRLAGMKYQAKAEGVLQQYFNVGDKVKIGIAKDPTQRVAKDTYKTTRAVVLTELGNINQLTLERGEMKENMTDYSAPGVQARFTKKEIKQGQRWETMAHATTPLNTKFLQVRTALEEYEQDQIYGKDFATWNNFLIDDYIAPTIQGMGRFDNPLMSVSAGVVTGGVLGRLLLKGGPTTKAAMILGGVFGLASNAFYKMHKEVTGEAWIPKRRRVEEDINEYFDVLKYVKYEGLYQKAREEILVNQGFDVESVVADIDNNSYENKKRKKELEEEKKALFLEQPEGWDLRKKEINAELQLITERKDELYLPMDVLQALSYKDKRDTTLYAVDPHDDLMKVMKAFPSKDKWFFMEFAEATLEEQEKILELVPENQKRIYKAMWGRGLDEQKPLEHYAEKYGMPDWTWEGWNPEFDLDDIKVKAVHEAGLDLTDFGFWEDDLFTAEFTPDLEEDGGNNIYEEKAFEGFTALQQNLINVLQGRGLYDVNVVVKPSESGATNVRMRYEEDVSGEVEEHFRRNAQDYM